VRQRLTTRFAAIERIAEQSDLALKRNVAELLSECAT
jgi:hypothetical protein